jgi:di/tricarboxylate transporter
MIYLAAAIVTGTLIAMASGKVPPVLALATGLAIAGITGVAEPSELAAGLSNAGVITVACMLVVAKGVAQTGLISRVTWALLSDVTDARQALRRLVLPVGIASALINTTPIVAMLVPATRELQETRRIPVRSVLLPITHVTTIFGTITLIGASSNLLIAGIAKSFGIDVNMFSFAPVGLPVAVVVSVMIYFLAPHLLGADVDERADVAKEWRTELRVGPHALAIGKTAEAIGVASTQEFEFVGIARAGEEIADSPIAAEDVLIFRSTEAGVVSLWKNANFGLSPQRLYTVSIGPGESGTYRDIERRGASIEIVAAHTNQPIEQSKMESGQICFVTGSNRQELQNCDAVALWRDAASRPPQPNKSLVAILILVAVIVSATLGLAAIELAAFCGALAMVLFGVLTPASAVRALNWNVLFILAGSIGLGTIVVTSGLAAKIAEGIRYLSAGNTFMVILVLAITTAALTNVITNAAAASILTPIGVALAVDLHIDPVTILAMIGTCISLTFVNPFGHQSNLMVMGPGGYTNAVFIRFGAPLIAIAVVAAVVVAYLHVRI